MFIIKKINKKGIVAVIVTIVAVVLIIFKFSFWNTSGTTAYSTAIGDYCLEITENFTVEDFFKQFNLSVDEKTQQKADIMIPTEFNDVYEKYNELQKSQGLDLSQYKGEKAERYTYNVTNYPNNIDVRANIIVLNNRIIAGDLCTVSLDGVMTTLDDKTITQE